MAEWECSPDDVDESAGLKEEVMTYSKANARSAFLSRLAMFIREVETMPSFRGKTQAVRALRKISTLSALR
jgi:hypothetical protein